jgi:polar amino acid transport system permease protein
MDKLIEQFFDIDIMITALPTIVQGMWVTLAICAVVIPMGLIGGLLAALGMLSNKRWLRWSTIIFVDFFRAIPPLVLLIFVYAGLPFAGIQSIGFGQSEAARSTGLNTRQTMVYVILPQATRNVLPDLISNTVEVVKLTSLASVVSLGEMLYAADMARSITYNASPLMLVATIYLGVLWPLVRLVSRFERQIPY